MATVSQLPEWKTAPGSSFRSREDWSLKWWIMFALILSVVFHGVLMVSFETLSASLALSEPPPVRDIPERIQISPELLREAPPIPEIPDTLTDGGQPDVEKFKPELDDFDKAQMLPENQEIDLTPSVQEITNLVRAVNPNEEPSDSRPMASKMADMLGPQSMKTADLAVEMASVRKDLLSAPVSEKQMLLDATTLESTTEGNALDMNLLSEVKALGQGGADSGARVKGFSNLDDLLGQGGGKLGGSTAPILMPTDLLFEYGSADLAEGARLSLMKLGFLIQKNPDSLFIVEGHTDSFGSDDYNLRLSQARALAVVNWLRDSLRLGSDRIQAVGKGKSAHIAPSSGTVEQQAINRRVEIKVRPRK
jgi:outer membrane protein OmpA-like peptidoglycan-associated protein